MGGFFTRERFGRPQVLAGFLLLVFLAQCLWLVGLRFHQSQWHQGEAFRVYEGVWQWWGGPIAGTPSNAPKESHMAVPLEIERNSGYDPNHSALWYLIAGAPFAISRDPLTNVNDVSWAWLARTPYLVFGMVLGASLWYVSRRLYGNAGGYLALALYCFSPGMIR